MKLIIVDDEMHIVDYISTQINWKELGFNEVFSTTSPSKAKEMILNTQPDLLITDIRMPKISGLDLADVIKTNNLLTKVIIISGYSDFTYAQQALRLRTVDYLIKPIELSELISVVKRSFDTNNAIRIDHILDGKSKNLFFIEALSTFGIEKINEKIYSDLLYTWDSNLHKNSVSLKYEGEYLTVFSKYNSIIKKKSNSLRYTKSDFFHQFYSHLNIPISKYSFPTELKLIIKEKNWRELIDHGSIFSLVDEKMYVPFAFDLLYLLRDEFSRFIETINLSELLIDVFSIKDVLLENIEAKIKVENSLENQQGISEKTIIAIEQYILDNYNKQISLDILSEVFHLHPVTISRLFKAITGETFSKYLTRVRIENAVYLLESSNLLVKDIAEFVGYNKTQHFISLFKDYYGLTPQKYRRIYVLEENSNYD
ncbi:response regulator transcription factor [Fundicoccus sp. Sow4_H7]|uniref:response regulator transcription factor n=1 Tax=Fundicoccus sp. Sow4_H7 TaxID=3438784 RepID=UPI003F923EFD